MSIGVDHPEGDEKVASTGIPGIGRAVIWVRNVVHARLKVILTPPAHVLLRMGVGANHSSVAGVLLNLVAASLVVAGSLLLAGALYLLAGLIDLLDGILARLAKADSPFGAFLDSTLDRISEGLMFAAIAYWFAAAGDAVEAGLAVLALLGSLLVSYTWARAEALGIQCHVGIFTRAERVVLVAFGLVSGFLAEVIYLLVALTAYTIGERIHHAS